MHIERMIIIYPLSSPGIANGCCSQCPSPLSPESFRVDFIDTYTVFFLPTTAIYSTDVICC